MSLRISWKKKILTLNFRPEDYGSDWTDKLSLKDLVTRISIETKVPVDRIKLLHSGVLMNDLDAKLSKFGIRNNSKIMMLGDIPLPSPEEQKAMQDLESLRNQVLTVIEPKIEILRNSIDNPASTTVKKIEFMVAEVSEILLQLLLKVDGIISDIDNVRQARKDTVRFIQEHMDIVDTLKTLVAKLKASL